MRRTRPPRPIRSSWRSWTRRPAPSTPRSRTGCPALGSRSVSYRGPVRRWDVFWADLEPAVGHEQKGPSRPVIVVSNDGFNAAPFRLVTVVPSTKREGKLRSVYPFEVELPKGTLTSGHASIVMPHQIRTISALH